MSHCIKYFASAALHPQHHIEWNGRLLWMCLLSHCFVYMMFVTCHCTSKKITY